MPGHIRHFYVLVMPHQVGKRAAISYFNFLKPKGQFFDFTLDGSESPLIKEAEAIGAFAVDGLRIFAHIDGYWLQMVANKKFEIKSLWDAYKQKFQPKV